MVDGRASRPLRRRSPPGFWRERSPLVEDAEVPTVGSCPSNPLVKSILGGSIEQVLYGEIDKSGLSTVWAEGKGLVGPRLGLVLKLDVESTFRTCKKECMLVQVLCNQHEES